MKDNTIYEKCPVYKSDRFMLRLVEPGDAEDLLRCYSDASAVGLMNSDNCSCSFHFEALSAMSDMINGWLGAYEEGAFIRFSIVDTRSSSAIGTIEIFDITRELGIYRLDLCSVYETEDHIFEILRLSVERFLEAYGVKRLLVKAIPTATERISALLKCGFVQADQNTKLPRLHWTWIEGEQKPVTSIPYGEYYIYNRL